MRAELFGIFLDEALRHAARALALLDRPGALGEAEIAELFRELHSVKGMTALLGLDEIVTTAHAAEDLADALRRGELTDSWSLREPARAAVLRLSADLSGLRSPGSLGAVEPEAPDVPLRGLVPVFEAAVARWAAAENRRVRLLVEGPDVPVPRRTIESLLDPVGHLLRNAVVHGIEDAGERVAAGKPPEGTVRLAVWPTPRGLAIEVSDDGRGLPPAELDRLRRGDVSPAAQPRLLAGRGVGLAAVGAAAARADGRVILDADPGAGFRAALFLPLPAGRVAPVPS